jgi:hypothetical protein
LSKEKQKALYEINYSINVVEYSLNVVILTTNVNNIGYLGRRIRFNG